MLRVKKAGMSVTTNEKEKPLEEEKKYVILPLSTTSLVNVIVFVF